jgi:HEAT repeat protein
VEKKRVIGFALLLLVLAGGLGWFLSRPREPMYDGKPLSFWLESYPVGTRTETSVQEADHALQAIGTNAIPMLFEMTSKEDSTLELKLMALLKKQRVVKIAWLPATYWKSLAGYGFAALGADGSKAVPSLIKIYEKSHSIDTKLSIIIDLRVMGPNAKEAVPFLVSIVETDQTPLFRLMALQALGNIHSNPDCAVPTLIKCLDDSTLDSRVMAVQGLGQFGPAARTAVPALVSLIKKENNPLRSACLAALQKIDPEAATNAQASISSGTNAAAVSH